MKQDEPKLIRSFEKGNVGINLFSSKRGVYSRTVNFKTGKREETVFPFASEYDARNLSDEKWKNFTNKKYKEFKDEKTFSKRKKLDRVA